MKDKAKRLRGSKTHGRGYNKHKSGAKGGTGKAGLWDHKRFSAILQEKKSLLKKVTSIRDIESKLQRFIKKGYIVQKVVNTDKGAEKEFHFQKKFTDVYGKILSQGQPSGKYIYNRNIKSTKSTLAKFK